jgi:hypothetical protein
VCIVINNSRVKAITVPLPPQFSHLELQAIDLLGDTKLRLFTCCLNGTCTGIFLNFCYNFGLRQLVNSPTRADHILDLVLSNDYACVLNVNVFEPFSTSDHCQVRFDVLHKLPSSRPTLSHSFRDFSGANWDQIKLFLANVDFYDVFHDDLPARGTSLKIFILFSTTVSIVLCLPLAAKLRLKLAYSLIHLAFGKKFARNPKCGVYIVHFGPLRR